MIESRRLIDLVVKYTGTVMDYYCIAFCVMHLYNLECMVYVRECCRCNGESVVTVYVRDDVRLFVCEAMRY